MFNHRQATGHEPTVALRQQSARSTQGILVHSRVCGKLQDKQGKGEREERERTAGCVAFKYLSDYLDTHLQIVLDFKPTHTDIKWFATVWHWTWYPSAEHARRRSHSPECRTADRAQLCISSNLGCLAPINPKTTEWWGSAAWGRSQMQNNAEHLKVLGGSLSAKGSDLEMLCLCGPKNTCSMKGQGRRGQRADQCLSLRTLTFG